MGIRNSKKQELDRLNSKTLDAQFSSILQHGLNCSPFEAEAIIKVVREVYGPYMLQQQQQCTAQLPPGTMSLVAVDAEEPAGKPIVQCQKRTIRLQVHRGTEDDRLLQQGAENFRQARIADLCQEALSQGALLTREDLAYRIFFVSLRTLSRDLFVLRQQKPSLAMPLRSTVHDIGPVLSHRVQIVRLALQGKTVTEICQSMRHSAAAVANYLDTFTRCAQLSQKKMSPEDMAFVLHRGRSLIQQYLQLLAKCRQDKTMAYHLKELLQIGHSGPKKNHPTRRPPP